MKTPIYASWASKTLSRHRLLLGLLITLLMLPLSTLAANVTDIYQPSHQTPSALLRAINPLYGSEAKFSAEQHQLIIRAEQAIVDEILELLAQLDHPARVFHIEVSDKPATNPRSSQLTAGTEQAPKTKSYSTKQRSLKHSLFRITEDSPIVLTRETQTERLVSTRPFWGIVETVPVKQESLRLQLRTAGQSVYVDFQLQTLTNGQWKTVDSQVRGNIGEWLAVAAVQKSTITDKREIRHSSTQRSDPANLYIKVSVAN